MPKRKGEDKIPGFVKIDILKQLGLGVVEVRMLDPQLMYDNYLRNRHLNLSELQWNAASDNNPMMRLS